MATDQNKREVLAFLREGGEGQQLIQQAHKGDVSACTTLFEQLEKAGIAEEFALLASDPLDTMLRDEYTQPLLYEAFRRRMEVLRAQLSTPTTSPLEHLLIERILVCGHHLHLAEMRMTRNIKAGVSFQAGTFFEKSAERAQKRYLQAVQSLALVRKLQVPLMQINIGSKQINVAQSGSAFPGALPCLEDASGTD